MKHEVKVPTLRAFALELALTREDQNPRCIRIALQPAPRHGQGLPIAYTYLPAEEVQVMFDREDMPDRAAELIVAAPHGFHIPISLADGQHIVKTFGVKSFTHKPGSGTA